ACLIVVLTAPPGKSKIVSSPVCSALPAVTAIVLASGAIASDHQRGVADCNKVGRCSNRYGSSPVFGAGFAGSAVATGAVATLGGTVSCGAASSGSRPVAVSTTANRAATERRGRGGPCRIITSLRLMLSAGV